MAGSETANMHLYGHLPCMVLISGFCDDYWFFGFEKSNGKPEGSLQRTPSIEILEQALTRKCLHIIVQETN